MNNKEIERLEALLTKIRGRIINNIVTFTPNQSCIQEEDLEYYLDQALPKNMIEALESHLACCPVCLNRLIILKEMRVEEFDPVPQKLVDRARDLVQVKSDCLELVLGFAKNTIHIIRNSGILLSSEPILDAVRGEKEAGMKKATDYVAVRKAFGHIAVDVNIERINGSYKLMVNSLDTKTGQPPTNIRLILCSMGRELNSVDDSEAVFYIKLKKYIVKIIHSDYELGDIHLDLRSEE